MKFYSKDFQNMENMPKRFTADGENISPVFKIEDVPRGVKSLLLLCHDPDATRGFPWVHWVVFNINPQTVEISNVNLPDGAQEGLTSFESVGYGGPSPSPSSGKHRYVFTLYALSSPFNLPFREFSCDEILSKINPLILDFSSWIGTYERL